MSNSITSSTATSPATITGKAHAELTGVRRTIDAIDQQIVALLRRRKVNSRTAQALKVEAGEPRVDISREREIIASYVEELGPSGARLAHDILNFSKGA